MIINGTFKVNICGRTAILVLYNWRMLCWCFLGSYDPVFYFCGCHYESVHPLRNFLAVLHPPTLQCNIETQKEILDTGVQRCLWGGGKGWACVNSKKLHKLMQMCPKTFVYCLDLIFFLRITPLVFIFAGNAQSVSESWSL